MKRQSNVTLERTPSRIKVERLLSMLTECEMTRADVAKGLFLSDAQAYRYLRCLCSQGKVYVKRWERSQSSSGGMPTAFYAAGDKPSAPRPRPLTRAEQSRRKYKRMKKDEPEKYMVYLAKAREKARKRNGRQIVKEDPMWSWIPRRDCREAA